MLRTLLFDLDGTLLDTAPDMAWALNRVLEGQGRAPLPLERIRSVVSHGSKALMSLAFPDLTEAQREPLREAFLTLYRNNLFLDTALFPGLAPVLARLEQTGRPWGVVTNKPAWLTEPLLEGLGLLERAACVISGDSTPRRKPDPLPLRLACERIGVDPVHAIYVGDAPRDIEAGHAAGMTTVVALWGYIGDDDRPEQWGADHLLEDPRSLLGLFPDDASRREHLLQRQ
ncbi:MAG: phosphoglycolate phosphatase [Gammaproteobacteria bacterium]|nr:MAG: phosphoglycolate phosphatase [Gammaproteobacteria bacterium]